ncbi:MAG: hypothetical protein Q4A79_02640, partial [Candidatus Saccharibacteria bacterium]|nr:hypothetical protein [Candidatus Saccharibacteria bacterium]
MKNFINGDIGRSGSSSWGGKSTKPNYDQDKEIGNAALSGFNGNKPKAKYSSSGENQQPGSNKPVAKNQQPGSNKPRAKYSSSGENQQPGSNKPV